MKVVQESVALLLLLNRMMPSLIPGRNDAFVVDQKTSGRERRLTSGIVGKSCEFRLLLNITLVMLSIHKMASCQLRVPFGS
jgi:hypothetical protein